MKQPPTKSESPVFVGGLRGVGRGFFNIAAVCSFAMLSVAVFGPVTFPSVTAGPGLFGQAWLTAPVSAAMGLLLAAFGAALSPRRRDRKAAGLLIGVILIAGLAAAARNGTPGGTANAFRQDAAKGTMAH